MSALSLSCTPTGTRDTKQIVINDDNIFIVENKIRGGKISIKNLTWDVNAAFQTTISLPKNSTATFHGNAFLQNMESNVKFIAIVNENSINAEKRYENSNVWFQYANTSPIPMGGLTVLSGTNDNRLTGTFKFFNGSPSSNISNITGATYDVSVSIIAGI